MASGRRGTVDIERIRHEISQGGKFHVKVGCSICVSVGPSSLASASRDPHKPKENNSHRCESLDVKLYGKNAWSVWKIIREPKSNCIKEVCQRKYCELGLECLRAHSEVELHIWKVLEKHNLSVAEFQDAYSALKRRPGPPRPQPNPYPTPPVSPAIAVLKKKVSVPVPHAFPPAVFPPLPGVPARDVPHFFQQVLENFPERFLFACERCFYMEPRIIVEMIGDQKKCPWCSSPSPLMLHETIEVNSNNELFHEYQPIRKRMSTFFAQCRQAPSCTNPNCKFTHSFLESKIWWMELNIASRESLVSFCIETCKRKSHDNVITQNGAHHCSYCSRNFATSEDHCAHLLSELHIFMVKQRRKDEIWLYRKCSITTIAYCDSKPCPESENCPLAHSKDEYEEWIRRAQLSSAKNSYSSQSTPASYMESLRKRVQTEDLQEIKTPRCMDEVIQMEKKFADGKLNLRQFCSVQGLKRIAFLQESFKLKIHTTSELSQYAVVEDGQRDFVYDIVFKNPNIYGQYSGTLLLDYENSSLSYLNISVIVVGLGSINAPIVENLAHDWREKRTVINYPDLPSTEPSYDNKVKDLERRYQIPPRKALNKVELINLTPSNYANQMHNFLYKEEMARQAVLTRLNIQCEVQVNSKIFLASGNLLVANTDSLLGTFSSPTRLSADSDEGLMVRDSCSKVLIGDSKKKAFAYECRIEHWAMDEVYIQISSRCVKDLELKDEQTATLMVQFKLDRGSFCLRHHAIDELKNRCFLICPMRNIYAKMVVANHFQPIPQLDETQNPMLQYIHSVKAPEPHNVETKIFPPLVAAGPFGTGKTHTIRNVILSILRTYGQRARILLCTHSNSAADLYIKDLASDTDWIEWKSKILRVMYHRRSPGTVLVEEVLDFCLFRENRTGRCFRYPTIQEIMKYQLVITTFPITLALGSLGSGLGSGAFTHIFLDEASQAMEPEVIMPLTLASLHNTRVVMAGDHRQINERMFIEEDCRMPTLLERVYEAYNGIDCDRHYRLLLNNNYRCVEGLLQLISKLFYKENILKKKGNVECVPGLEPVHFIHVQGECKMTEKGEFINITEAEQILLKVRKLTVETGLVKPSEIVVTAAYYQQVMLIRDIMRKNRLHSVSVQTARNLQALQYKVVILSCVMRRVTCLSCVGENFGFLTDPNLLNTVLTRAQSLVIAVGDAVTLCSTGKCTKKWKTFFKHCEESGSTHPPKLDMETIRAETHLAELKLRATAKEFLPVHMTEQHEADHAMAIDIPGPQWPQEMDEEDRNEEDSDADSWTSDDLSFSDAILDDMLKKVTGQDPNDMRIKTDKRGREFVEYGDDSDDKKEEEMQDDYEEDDPNFESNQKIQNRHKTRDPIFPKHTVDELERMLEAYPAQYKRCRIFRKNWYTAIAVPLKSEDVHSVHINTTQNLGRTFNKDEVVVEIIPDVDQASEDTYGRVIGVLKRYRNPRSLCFLCKPKIKNSDIMCPINNLTTKFAILTPKNHKVDNPNTIPIYKANYKRGDEFELELNDCVKYCPHTVYAVRFLKWSEHCSYPLGFVEKTLQLDDYEKCLSVEFGLDQKYRKSVALQVEKLQIPRSNGLKVIPVFTIAAKGSTDIANALSIEKCTQHRDCFKIGVHVVDIASIIPKDSPLDKLAQRRRGSFGNIANGDMLPMELSHAKCSLLPEQTLPVISVFFHSCKDNAPHLEDNHSPPERNFVKSIKQLSYEEAEELLGTSQLRREEVAEGLQQSIQQDLRNIWSVFWDWRLMRLNTAAFSKDQMTLEETYTGGRARILMEESLLLYDSNMAKYLLRKGVNVYVQTQQPPNKELLENFLERYLMTISNSTYLIAAFQDQIFENFVDQENVEMLGRNYKGIASCVMVAKIGILPFLLANSNTQLSLEPVLEKYRAILAKPEWVQIDSQNAMQLFHHYSLHLPIYTRCSSTLRRYSDIFVQRCLLHAMENTQLSQDMLEEMKRIDWDFDDKVEEFEQKFEAAKLAHRLKECPRKYIASISEVTGTNTVISIPSLQNKFPEGAHRLDYCIIKADVAQEGQRRYREFTAQDDSIMEQVEAVWRFRSYDMKEQHERRSESRNPALAVSIPQVNWDGIIEIMKNTPSRFDSDTVKHGHDQNMRLAFSELTCLPNKSSKINMSGHTRNAPTPLPHHCIVKKILKPGTRVVVQLAPNSNKQILPEPCVQLLSIDEKFDVCVQHQKHPTQVFAPDLEDFQVGKKYPDNWEAYCKKWKSIVRINSAHMAVAEGNSVTVHGVSILWNPMTGSVTDREPRPSTVLTSLISSSSFQLDSEFCRERYITFSRNDLLCLRLKGVPCDTSKESSLFGDIREYTAVFHGYVTSVTDDDKGLKVYFDLFDQLEHLQNKDFVMNKENSWTVELLPLEVSSRHMLENLDMITSNLIRWICLRSIRSFPVKISKAGQKWIKKRDLDGMPYQLNDNQQDLKERAAKSNFFVIQGSPGGGKSVLGAYIAATFCKINRTRSGHLKKVLFCGPSNKSVDVAAGYLKNIEHLKVIRLYGTSYEERVFPNPIRPERPVLMPGYKKKVPEEKLKSISLHHLIRKEENPWSRQIRDFDSRVKISSNKFKREDIDKYMAAVSQAKKYELMKCDIIICTCVSSKQLKHLLGEEAPSFAQCIIDESGMCSEPETLLPLVVSNPEQIVLIGDHMQLQPVVICKRAEGLGLGLSLFSAYSGQARMLTQQYRMNEDILELPSRKFYNNRLGCAESVRYRAQPRFFPSINQDSVIFWDVRGKEKVQQFKSIYGHEKSKYNLMEVDSVVKLLEYLTQTSPARSVISSIMVISPYTAQCVRIQERVNASYFGQIHVQVGTVINSQGSEADYVILSLVRSLPDVAVGERNSLAWLRKNLGFLQDPNQTNVALTRAKYGMCIIGNRKLLQTVEPWGKIIEFYESRRCVRQNLL